VSSDSAPAPEGRAAVAPLGDVAAAGGASPSPRRRWFAIAALLAGFAVAVPSVVASGTTPKPPKPVTIVRHEKVSAAGTYAVVVTVAPPATAQSINVFAAGQAQKGIAVDPGGGVTLAFYVHLSHRTFNVRVVGQGKAPRFTVRSALQTGSSVPTGTTGTTGPTGATGATGPIIDYGPTQGPYNKLVWDDEFNGTAGTPPNPAYWTSDVGGGCGDGTLSSNSAANDELDGNGHLMITAANSPLGYTSAQVETAGKFSFEYGEIEARIWVPAGAGLCSQFWLLGDSATLGTDCWPTCGELDAHESIGNAPQIAYAFLHGPSPDHGAQEWAGAVTAATPLTSGFHTYGLIWRPNLITWTIDGVPFASATPKQLSAGSTWVFNNNTFHVVFDLAVGGWPGPPSPNTVFPARMFVDWVRVYQ
jgi:beta-glucanase (GH16 family)